MNVEEEWGFERGWALLLTARKEYQPFRLSREPGDDDVAMTVSL